MIGLDRRLAVHLQQPQRDMVRIFAHPLFRSVGARHHLLGAVERPLQQHQLQPRVSRGQRAQPFRPELRVHLPPPIGDRHRHPAPPARLADVAGLAKHREEARRLGLRPVALRSLLQLRPRGGDQRQLLLPRHPTLPFPK